MCHVSQLPISKGVFCVYKCPPGKRRHQSTGFDTPPIQHRIWSFQLNCAENEEWHLQSWQMHVTPMHPCLVLTVMYWYCRCFLLINIMESRFIHICVKKNYRGIHLKYNKIRYNKNKGALLAFMVPWRTFNKRMVLLTTTFH